MYDFITIERSFACGGHQIATKLADKLGYRLYDRNVVVETCKRLNLPFNTISHMDEQAPVKTPFKVLHSEKYPSLEEQIFDVETDIINKAAEEPGAVFVGRCASEILKDRKALRVFITASDEYRMERALKIEKIAKERAKNDMHKNDVRRQKYFSAHSTGKWGDPDYFDIILSSSYLGIDACVDILAAACLTK